MNIRPIRNVDDHEKAVARLSLLMDQDLEPESDEAMELDVLATLIQKFESEHFPIEAPEPLEAIHFRMDQMGLRNKDLVPYIGSASKVSEVLNGKRTLSLTMIRNLHQGLGIPAEVLIRNPDESKHLEGELRPGDFPAREMHKRGYFRSAPESWTEAKKQLVDLLKDFFRDAGVREASPAYCRSTAHYRQTKTLDSEALLAWQAQVLKLSRKRPVSAFVPGLIDAEFLSRIADLSVFDEGPWLARHALEKHGIPVVMERHLPRTYLDGAAFLRDDGVPVLGLTLRHDKLDNFWFTLLHELVHAGWHLTDGCTAIFDDVTTAATDEFEREADAIATEALIPNVKWQEARLTDNATADAAYAFARQINRHPSIVVGRIQHELGNYKLLARSPGVGHRKVRLQFDDFERRARFG